MNQQQEQPNLSVAIKLGDKKLNKKRGTIKKLKLKKMKNTNKKLT
jgi:hypothetical protein